MEIAVVSALRPEMMGTKRRKTCYEIFNMLTQAVPAEDLAIIWFYDCDYVICNIFKKIIAVNSHGKLAT